MTVTWFCVISCGSPATCRHRHADRTCMYEYDAARSEEKYRWTGDEPPPRRWRAGDGTVVYRTFADYCDD